MKLKEIQELFHKELDSIYEKEEVDNFFFLLIDEYYDVHRIEIAIQPETTINKKEQDPIFKALDQLKKEKPIQYVLGKTEFYGLPFKVNSNVLIPRPETEELVSFVINSVSSSTVEKPLNVLDVGTGSGCIAISLAKNIPNAKLIGLDVSTDALKVAKENATLNGIDIEFIEANILEKENVSLSLPNYSLPLDIIVSNPPYVRKKEKSEIKNNVLNNEPHLALFVEDDDALQFYRVISEFAVNNLRDYGLLFLEINEYLGQEMIGLLKNYNFRNIELKKDIFGKDRMIKATK